jgi:hypothetical protein
MWKKREEWWGEGRGYLNTGLVKRIDNNKHWDKYKKKEW